MIVGFLLFALLIILILISFFFFNKEKGYYQYESRVKNVKNTTIANSKSIGWIQVQGTTIDSPVINETEEAYQSGENYLWRTSYYVEGNNRETIYGHNILNVSPEPIINGKNHTNFEPLMAFVYEEFAKKNLYINYTYGGKNHLYKIYGVRFDYGYNANYLSYSDEEKVTAYINNVRKNSIYDYDIEVNNSDHLISLITCTRYFGINGKTQFIIDAREIRDNEKNEWYFVETNKNYDIIKE